LNQLLLCYVLTIQWCHSERTFYINALVAQVFNLRSPTIGLNIGYHWKHLLYTSKRNVIGRTRVRWYPVFSHISLSGRNVLWSVCWNAIVIFSRNTMSYNHKCEKYDLTIATFNAEFPTLLKLHCSSSQAFSLYVEIIQCLTRSIFRLSFWITAYEHETVGRVRHCVIYLSNHWSLELLMQDFYQLIHEDYLTCAKMVRGRTHRQFSLPCIHSPAALNDDVDCLMQDASAKTTRPIDIMFTRFCREIQDEQIDPFRMFLRWSWPAVDRRE